MLAPIELSASPYPQRQQFGARSYTENAGRPVLAVSMSGDQPRHTCTVAGRVCIGADSGIFPILGIEVLSCKYRTREVRVPRIYTRIK